MIWLCLGAVIGTVVIEVSFHTVFRIWMDLGRVKVVTEMLGREKNFRHRVE